MQLEMYGNFRHTFWILEANRKCVGKELENSVLTKFDYTCKQECSCVFVVGGWREGYVRTGFLNGRKSTCEQQPL